MRCKFLISCSSLRHCNVVLWLMLNVVHGTFVHELKMALPYIHPCTPCSIIKIALAEGCKTCVTQQVMFSTRADIPMLSTRADNAPNASYPCRHPNIQRNRSCFLPVQTSQSRRVEGLVQEIIDAAGPPDLSESSLQVQLMQDQCLAG